MPVFVGKLTGVLSCLGLSVTGVVPKLRSPLTRTIASGSNLPPRQFLTSGFVTIDSAEKIEEEELPSYVAEKYYPVAIGEILAARYQVVSKLGYGMSSTTWLCRDLDGHGFNTLKICVRDQRPVRELAVSDHLRNASDDHFGKRLVRLILDSFEISGPDGNHTCLVYRPLGMSFTEFQSLCPDNKLPVDMLRKGVQLVLIALAFIHENDVVHTDISANNILQGIEDTSVLRQIEEDELARPIARKILNDRQIYFSRPVPVSAGLPVLSDFGEARVSKSNQRGDIMPGIYRAPEVILDMEWDNKVDIWSIGVMAWDMATGGHLFLAKKGGTLNDEQHLAEMVSLMGPPPPEFLQRSVKSLRYWDSEGNWKGSVPIPEQSLESRAEQYHGDDKELFLSFLRRVLCWVPEARPSAEELAYDDFLMQPVRTDSLD
ncbi:hypothetical protein ASPZODRAFT_88270 [Penicilliopsis zonata CBS 506.65]|uniref:non-specific serine/threonine protein kinase n=1 Tax=Penicilliopsis zonata CBS 506.65 TaxID=1073090 RepID=A0A1L9SWZ8_9EURO|nr:hypothetical protein ASPZODRAFT_88270 [Penicilliopsis zonata CBS 506.65]OJJ51657.1 hypothetical protein ASPZODRAFT_88270 [Penicilliopsis zonata CBS 506.65]